MKKLKRLIAGLLIFTPAAVWAQIAPAPTKVAAGANDGNSYSGNFINAPGGTSAPATPTLDLSVYDASKVSAQLLFSSVTFANTTFTDGSESVGTMTVVTNSGLKAASATDSLTVVATSSLSGATLNIQNTTLTNGSQWFVGANVHATAVSIAAAISLLPNLAASAGGGASGVVYATATAGSYANGIAFTSSNGNITVASGYMTGGQDNAVLTINGVALKAGSQWTVGNVSSNTAASIATAINTAFTTLSSTNNTAGQGSVVYATSTLNGAQYNYSLVSSTPTALSVNSQAFHGGTNPGLTLGSMTLSSTNATGLTLGLPVLFSSSSATGANITLVSGTTYYAVPLTSYSYQLVKYATSAVAGAPLSDFVTITSTNSGVTAHTYTLAPLPWTGGASTLLWQSSNDNANWFTSSYTGNVSTGTVTIYSTTTASDLPIDFGTFNYRYLRLNYTPPATGAVKLVVPVNIKQDGIGRF